MSPTSFYELTIREANLVLEGYENEKKEQYYMDLYSNFNAIGMALGGKEFKPLNPFETKELKPRETSIEERKQTLEYLKEKFKKFGGEI